MKQNNFFKRNWLPLISILLIVALVLLLTPHSVKGYIDLNKPLETQIAGTPAWIQNNSIIAYGENPGFNLSIEYLISNHIYFVWDAQCIHCENVINNWTPSDWNKYQNSGYTKRVYIFQNEVKP